MDELIELPAKWIRPSDGRLFAEPAPGVWCSDFGGPYPHLASFDRADDPRFGQVEPAPEGAVVVVRDDQHYRETLEFMAQQIERWG